MPVAESVWAIPSTARSKQLTVRLDADVVAWLRRQGRGYRTRLNQVLREAMLEDIKKSA
ncbi:MAG TPA: BrnA antitoxin family protein [Bryobacteraceae bacterium]|nr:BrnA antitoxin family protein [Bryobacteraceae bacterium]